MLARARVGCSMGNTKHISHRYKIHLSAGTVTIEKVTTDGDVTTAGAADAAATIKSADTVGATRPAGTVTIEKATTDGDVTAAEPSPPSRATAAAAISSASSLQRRRVARQVHNGR